MNPFGLQPQACRLPRREGIISPYILRSAFMYHKLGSAAVAGQILRENVFELSFGMRLDDLEPSQL
jgi:hypothetical protein